MAKESKAKSKSKNNKSPKKQQDYTVLHNHLFDIGNIL